MKKSIKSTLTLVCICAAISLLLAVTNAITAPIIEENQKKQAEQALVKILPVGSGFRTIDLTDYILPETVTEVYTEDGGGYVITLTTSGYASDFVIMCGVRANGTVSGTLCLSSNETLGHEKLYGEFFIGLDRNTVNSVDTVAGATKTTAAYRAAVRDALQTAAILREQGTPAVTEAANLSKEVPDHE